MSAWPVTRALFQKFRPDRYREADVSGVSGEVPAVHVTWREAVELCDFLSAIDGRTYRLPTEAEWEYAARGGIEGAEYPWGGETADDTRCNFLHRSPVPVGCYPPNGFGLFDCVGNTFEWTADLYLKEAYGLTPADITDPKGPSREELKAHSPLVEGVRVVRGGGYLGIDMCKVYCRNSWRLGWPEEMSSLNLSVRLVTDADD